MREHGRGRLGVGALRQQDVALTELRLEQRRGRPGRAAGRRCVDRPETVASDAREQELPEPLAAVLGNPFDCLRAERLDHMDAAAHEDRRGSRRPHRRREAAQRDRRRDQAPAAPDAHEPEERVQ